MDIYILHCLKCGAAMTSDNVRELLEMMVEAHGEPESVWGETNESKDDPSLSVPYTVEMGLSAHTVESIIKPTDGELVLRYVYEDGEHEYVLALGKVIGVAITLPRDDEPPRFDPSMN